MRSQSDRSSRTCARAEKQRDSWNTCTILLYLLGRRGIRNNIIGGHPVTQEARLRSEAMWYDGWKLSFWIVHVNKITIANMKPYHCITTVSRMHHRKHMSVNFHLSVNHHRKHLSVNFQLDLTQMTKSIIYRSISDRSINYCAKSLPGSWSASSKTSVCQFSARSDTNDKIDNLSIDFWSIDQLLRKIITGIVISII